MKERKTFSKKFKLHKQTLSTALEKAKDDRIIYYNEAKKVEIPKQVKRDMTILNQKEVGRFLRSVEENGSRHYSAYILVLATGLRLGELLRLTWENIDFKNRKIVVKQQVTTESRKVKIKKVLKTKASRRLITFPENVMEKLRKQELLQISTVDKA